MSAISWRIVIGLGVLLAAPLAGPARAGGGGDKIPNPAWLSKELERIRAHDFANAEALVPGLKKQLDDLEEIAPVVPERYYDQVEAEWKKKGIEFVGKAVCLYPDKAGHCPYRPKPAE